MKSRATAVGVIGVVLAGGLAACATGDQAPSATLTIGTGGVFTTSNNPFAPTSSASANGWAWLVYEPLVQSNAVVPDAEPVPWLASDFAWTEDFTSITFTARDGVRWSDGEPFGADDIAYTFELIRDDPALNSGGIPYDEVAVDGDDVTVSFSSSQFVNQSQITDQFVVPEHVWSDVDDPSTYADSAPVGTGPFTFTSTTSSVAQLDRNDAYWGEQTPVETVRYRAFQGNDAIINALAAHDVDWASSFALNQEEGFTSRDPRNTAWNVATLGIDAFVLNIDKAPFDDPVLRRAINLVIDRERASQLATAGLSAPVTSVTGIPEPVGEVFIAEEYRGQTLGADVDAATALLEEAGYTVSPDALLTPDGEPVTMTLIDPAGWTDYLTALQVISENLAQIGIASTIETPSQDAWNAALAVGEFDGTIRYSNAGVTPYDLYETYMNSNRYKPVGETIDGNWSRFQDPAAGEALLTYAEAADDGARQEALVDLQRLWVEEVPAIALFAKSSTGMFAEVRWQGWPSADDPYADPGILSRNISLILTRLEPVE